jgi:TPR repeat protein
MKITMQTRLLKLLVCSASLFISFSAHAGEREREELRCPSSQSRFAQIQKKAQANNAEAQTVLASCYDLGRNVAANRKENIHWLTLAANQGYAPAEFQLGHIYLYGSGVPADYQQALLWEKKAAEQGEAEAQRDLAFMYEQGFGTKADQKEATVWNRKAAEQGEREAQLQLAKALQSSNRTEAMEWYQKAGRQELPEAQLRLAQMLFEKLNRNCKAAMAWYERASGNGVAQAMYELGKIYQSGDCAEHNNELAYRWFQTGGRYGSEESRGEAEKLSSLLTQTQKKAIDLKIEKWIGKHSGADKREDKEEKEDLKF